MPVHLYGMDSGCMYGHLWTLMDTYGQKYGYQPGDTGLESKDTLAATAGAAAADASHSDC